MAAPKSELLPVLPMDDVVVLPHMAVTLAVEGDSQKAAIEAARQGNRMILLVPRIEGHFGSIGTVARLGDSAELPTGAEAFMIRGEYRARLGSGQADIAGATRQVPASLLAVARPLALIALYILPVALAVQLLARRQFRRLAESVATGALAAAVTAIVN